MASNTLIEKQTDYKFRDRKLLHESSIAAGSSACHNTCDTFGNKRLALLGDKVIALLIVDQQHEKGSTTST